MSSEVTTSTNDFTTTSEIVNKEKSSSQFRVYPKEGRQFEFYKYNHLNQTLEYVHKLRETVFPVGRWRIEIMEVISLLDEIFDESDPDNEKKQIFHSIQTGEACRKAYPDLDWFHLAGFLHDLGKVLSHPKMHNLPQWSVVGDTFPLGCAFSEKCVYPDCFLDNPDSKNSIYSQKLGIYSENVGFDDVVMSFGHDEYLYQVLKTNGCALPDEALYVIRFHSFYPWHDAGAYDYLANKKDLDLLPLVQAFQKCDLYSKIDEEVKVEDLLPYYEGLIKKYFPNGTELAW